MDWIYDPSIWASLISLIALEVVLGIDNIVFLSVVTNKLPEPQAQRARQIGLLLALLFRIMLLFAITWIIGLTTPVFTIAGQGFSWRDMILIGGGLFLIVKATQEVHGAIEGEAESHAGSGAAKATFGIVIGQIVLIDAIFSLDSIITAVGMADEVGVMIAAVIVAIAVMYLAAEPVSDFIKKHPTTKMLALSFLMLIGVALVADGFHFHVPRGYIYFAMAFAAGVEIFNILAKGRASRASLAFPRLSPQASGPAAAQTADRYSGAARNQTGGGARAAQPNGAKKKPAATATPAAKKPASSPPRGRGKPQAAGRTAPKTRG